MNKFMAQKTTKDYITTSYGYVAHIVCPGSTIGLVAHNKHRLQPGVTQESMDQLAALLHWANENNVRVTWKFIPHHKPSPFVIEAHVPKPDLGEGIFKFTRMKGKTVGDVCRRFLREVQ